VDRPAHGSSRPSFDQNPAQPRDNGDSRDIGDVEQSHIDAFRGRNLCDPAAHDIGPDDPNCAYRNRRTLLYAMGRCQRDPSLLARKASHKVWGTQLNEYGRYQAIDLE
jgi:hypothetical protein